MYNELNKTIVKYSRLLLKIILWNKQIIQFNVFLAITIKMQIRVEKSFTLNAREVVNNWKWISFLFCFYNVFKRVFNAINFLSPNTDFSINEDSLLGCSHNKQQTIRFTVKLNFSVTFNSVNLLWQFELKQGKFSNMILFLMNFNIFFNLISNPYKSY